MSWTGQGATATGHRWYIGGSPGPDSVARLFCFPFAGGSAAAYHRWLELAPPSLHVSPVEYPGRGSRVAEEPFASLRPLVRQLADLFEPELGERVAFFGHSMGGLVAYEVTRALRARGAPQPCHLFISATPAPDTPRRARPLAAVVDAPGDTEVLWELRNLGGTPPELLADEELMGIAVRAMRADSRAVASYEHRPSPPLDVPITVFGGRADRMAPPALLRGWQACTTAGYRLRLFAGDHFFLHAAAGEILATVSRTLAAARCGKAAVEGS